MASPRVARALSEPGFFVQHVAGENQPEKGSDDQTVLEHAKKINQTIVTDNHDLIVLCCEAEKSVVWLDPIDKDMTLAAQTLMCFGQIADWGTSLQQSGEALCIHARKPNAQLSHLTGQDGLQSTVGGPTSPYLRANDLSKR